MSNTLLTAPPPTAYPPRNRKYPLRDWIFQRVHGQKLVYNTCWEDPRCDREMMGIDSTSEIVMITSAGDNALAYLLDDPAAIHCVDVNPRQTALLELKRAAYRRLPHDAFFELFGRGTYPRFDHLYRQCLRPELSVASRRYWDKHGRYFRSGGFRAGLYVHGSSGAFAWAAMNVIRRNRRLSGDINALFMTQDQETQRRRYLRLEPRLLDLLVGGALRQRVSLSLLGVPASQRAFIDAQKDGLRGYLREAFRKIFLELPIGENYFYYVYVNGHYHEDCCPDYLRKEHYRLLTGRLSHLHCYTTTVANFLKRNPGAYSHFVLLDHQDWMAHHAPEALREEWRLILENSRPGTKILLRSASARPDTVPDFVLPRVRFNESSAASAASRDRVGTYAGTFLLEVL